MTSIPPRLDQRIAGFCVILFGLIATNPIAHAQITFTGYSYPISPFYCNLPNQSPYINSACYPHSADGNYTPLPIPTDNLQVTSIAVLGDSRTAFRPTLTVNGGSLLDSASFMSVDNGSVTVSSGGSLTLNSVDTNSPTIIGATGASEVTVTGGQLISNGYVALGTSSTGILTIQNSSIVSVAHMDVGFNTGGNGTVTVSDNSVLTVTGIGVNLGLGGFNHDQYGIGHMVVDGSQVNLTAKNSMLNLGFDGSGELAIRNAGKVDVNEMNIGVTGNGNGLVTVTGEGSSLTIHGALNIGHSTLTTVAAGLVAADDKATINVGQSIYIGPASQLSVTNSGRVSVGGGPNFTPGQGNTQLTIGSSGFSGTVTVDGGQISVSGTLAQVRVGAGTGSNGTLNVLDGGTVLIDGGSDMSTQSGMNIARESGSAGTVFVNGPGSRISTTGDAGYLNVAGSSTSANGTARLDLFNGAVVEVGGGGLNIGGGSGTSGNGTVTINSGSLIRVAGGGDGAGVQIGRGSGTGSLNVSAGGALIIEGSGGTGAPYINVGRDAGSSGVLDIRGTGSSVVISGDTINPFVAIGRGGVGTLTVADGGLLQLHGGGPPSSSISNLTSLNIGGGGGISGGTGSATITGANSRVELDGTDAIVFVGNGNGSHGSLSISNGGSLSAFALIVGQQGGSGTVNVSAGSISLTGIQQGFATPGAGAGINVGRSGGTGTLTLSNGASVTIYSGPGATSGAGVSIGGSGLTGGAGTGALTMNSGASLTISGDAPRSGIGIGSAGGTGTMTVSGPGTSVNIVVSPAGGGGNIALATTATAHGTLTVSNSANVNAGAQIGIGHNGIVSTGGTGTLIVASNGTVQAENIYVGTNGTIQITGGTLIASDSLVFDGRATNALTINGGHVRIGDAPSVSTLSVVLGDGGLLSIGAGSSITIAGGFQQTGGNVDLFIKGGEADQSRLTINGIATFTGGNIDIAFDGSLDLQAGQSFDIFQASGLVVQHPVTSGVQLEDALPRTLFNVTGLPSGLTFCDTYDASSGDLSLQLIDFNDVAVGGIVAQPNGATMGASFTPRCGISIDDAAGVGGFDHFNWLQVVTSDTDVAFCKSHPGGTGCVGLQDQSGALPSTPYIDPPLGGWYYQTVSSCAPGLFPVQDSLPWYLDEVYQPYQTTCGDRIGYRVGSPTERKSAEIDDFTLNFSDRPSGLATVDFLTCLAAITTQGSGLTLQGASTDLDSSATDCFAWSYSGGVSSGPFWVRDYVGDPGSGTATFLGFVALDQIPPDQLALLESAGRSSSVPEPPSLLLFSTLMVMWVWFAHRRRIIAARDSLFVRDCFPA